jgi:large subunit ribosomal protein L35
MPKQKVKKSISRRIKVTATGKLMRRGSHVRHLHRKKTKSQMRDQAVPKEITGTWRRKVRKLLSV